MLDWKMFHNVLEDRNSRKGEKLAIFHNRFIVKQMKQMKLYAWKSLMSKIIECVFFANQPHH